MKLYEDKAYTKEVTAVNFGIVLAGDTKKVKYYLYNNTDADVVEIVPTLTNKEVKIVNFPTELKAKQSSEVTFEWTASITIKKGLRTELSLKFFELYD